MHCVFHACWPCFAFDGTDGEHVLEAVCRLPVPGLCIVHVFESHVARRNTACAEEGAALMVQECVAAIQEHAFVTSPYPVIVTFENHADVENQKKIAEILSRLLGTALFVPEGSVIDSHASPEELKHKIIVR
jgi:hypothetical protein